MERYTLQMNLKSLSRFIETLSSDTNKVNLVINMQ